MRIPLKKWIVTSPYGEKRSDGSVHKGTDLRAKFESVAASFDGEAKTLKDPKGGFGLQLSNGLYKLKFWHLSEYGKLGSVKEGEIMAVSGNSGTMTTGPHLHVETYINKSILNPEIFFMIKNILIDTKAKTILSDVILEVVVAFFASQNIVIIFFYADNGVTNWWAKMHYDEKTPSSADVKDTYKTPGVYDFWYNLADVYGGRRAEDVIIHEILHCLFEDARLPDIHEFNWGVADNVKVLDYLINNKKNMDYIICGKEQFLVYEPLKIAFNIGDEQELDELVRRGLIGSPRPVENLDGYSIYPLVKKDRLRDLFGL